jgi:hypothetical protein
LIDFSDESFRSPAANQPKLLSEKGESDSTRNMRSRQVDGDERDPVSRVLNLFFSSRFDVFLMRTSELVKRSVSALLHDPDGA